jgi:hypothetical protein
LSSVKVFPISLLLFAKIEEGSPVMVVNGVNGDEPSTTLEGTQKILLF